MIKIFIFQKDDKICGWQIKGHSGYSERGSDIVCAAVSTASEMMLETLNQAGIEHNCDIKDGYMSVEILGEGEQNSLRAMVKIFDNLQKEYEKFVKMEVRKDVF